MIARTAAAPALVGLDRIVDLTAGRTAAAIRNVPSTLALFDSHFPRFPVLPGVLILGSLGELAALLMSETAGGAWELAAARTIRYRHFVRPGDSMHLHVDLLEPGVCAGRVLVAGKRVTTVGRLELSAAATGGAR
ncbi:hypothetical protein [Nocardia sp. NPDC046763]|uniref:3-hydroxyacyl-ACP dehydratase FabZ family protein n=1 Tax=Nocardia sp. NPDC046763 TaxID=3155256 RepID=UPI0033FD729E